MTIPDGPLHERESTSSSPQAHPYPIELFRNCVNGCPCHACVPANVDPFSFVAQVHLCHTCGNKRCPGAVRHTAPCSGSNEPGQPGSFYEHS